VIQLPDVVDDGSKPEFLSDDWVWSDVSNAWERDYGEYVLVYLHGYFCAFNMDNSYYGLEFYHFVMDEMGDKYSDESIQQTLDTVFGYTGGSIEKNYSLDDDLAALRDELLDEWECDCGGKEFYSILNGGITMYGCTKAGCEQVFMSDEIPSGVTVNVISVTRIDG